MSETHVFHLSIDKMIHTLYDVALLLGLLLNSASITNRELYKSGMICKHLSWQIHHNIVVKGDYIKISG